MINCKQSISGRILVVLALLLAITTLSGQEKRVAPGINAPFQKPDVAEFQGRFENEGGDQPSARTIATRCQAHRAFSVTVASTPQAVYQRPHPCLAGS